MEKCPADDCREMKSIKKTLYGDDGTQGVVGCMRKKISWTQLGATVMVIVAILGITYAKVDLSNAERFKSIEKKTEVNAESINKHSTNQAVIIRQLEIVDKRLTNIENKREEDVKAIHQRITSTKDEILKAIREIKK